MYWLSETVFSFDGDSHANVSAEQGMTWSSLLPTWPSGIASYLPFSALSLSRNGTITQCKVRTDFHWIFGTQRRLINREFNKLLKVCFTTNCLQQQQMMEESWGLILHRIEIFILNEMPCHAQAKAQLLTLLLFFYSKFIWIRKKFSFFISIICFVVVLVFTGFIVNPWLNFMLHTDFEIPIF